MIYKTWHDKHERVYTNPGTRFLDTFQETIDKNGIKELVVTGKTNIYKMIQEDLESTKIENILHRVAMGDKEALLQREVQYIDATTMPHSLMEIQNTVLKAKQEFDKFPIEVREIFNYSADQYIAEMGTEKFFEKMEPYNKKIQAIKEAGSAKEYEKKVAEQAKFEKDVAAAKGVTNES